MKKYILALILAASMFFCVYGQNSEPIDLILLLNTSSGMSASYDNVNNYITGAFLSEFLRIGDTFHLIVFSGPPKLDVARLIYDRGDIETIIGRMMLHYPVENGNDVKTAIGFAEEYVSVLPSRPKKIVIVSLGGSDVNNVISASRQKLSSKNTTLDFVQVTPGQPLSNLPVSGRSKIAAKKPSSTDSTSPSERPAPETSTITGQAQPQAQTQIQTQQPQSQAQTQTKTQDSSVAKTEVKKDASSANDKTSAVSTPQIQSEPSSVANETDKSDTKEPSVNNQTVYSKQETSNVSSSLSLPLIIVFIIIAIIVLGLIIFFAMRKLGSSPSRVMAQAASSESKPKTKSKEEKFVDHSKDLATYAALKPKQRVTPYSNRPVKKEIIRPAVINPNAPLLLNLFVEDQNTAIGKRNIHSLKSGYSLSVGGGKSDFLIFLVPIPSNIGAIHRNGSQCTFIPRKPRYFPDIGSNEVRDCINKTIRIISDKNYEMRFRFEMYEDPLASLNKILHSVKLPG